MKRSILIAEDEEAVRESICMYLSEEGYDCTAADNGRDAIEIIKQTRFDLVILDYLMPGKDGLEVLKVIRKHAPDTKVIMTSSYFEWEKAYRAAGLGVSKFFLKPLDFEELRAEVIKLMD